MQRRAIACQYVSSQLTIARLGLRGARRPGTAAPVTRSGATPTEPRVRMQGGKRVLDLTPEQREFARISGVSEASYAQSLLKPSVQEKIKRTR